MLNDILVSRVVRYTRLKSGGSGMYLNKGNENTQKTAGLLCKVAE